MVHFNPAIYIQIEKRSQYHLCFSLMTRVRLDITEMHIYTYTYAKITWYRSMSFECSKQMSLLVNISCNSQHQAHPNCLCENENRVTS